MNYTRGYPKFKVRETKSLKKLGLRAVPNGFSMIPIYTFIQKPNFDD